MVQEALAVRASLIGASPGQNHFAARTEPVSVSLHTTSPMGISSRKQDQGQSTTEPAEATGEDVLWDTNISDRPEPRRRMTYGEYMPSSTEDGSRTASVRLRTDRPSLTDVDVQFTAKLTSPETRATLTMIYPWGDDSPHLPQEIKTMLAMWAQLDDGVLEDHLAKETVTPVARRRRLANRIVSSVSAVTSWKPKQLIDYYRWSRFTPPTRVEGLSSAPLSTEKLFNLSSENLDMYLIEVLRLFRLQHDQFEPAAASQPRTGGFKPTTSRPPLKAASFSLIDYMMWLFSTITSQPSRMTIMSGVQSVSRLAILVDLFVESGRQLRAATQLDHRLGLCRLCCLAAHRIASYLASQQQNATPPPTRSGGASRGAQQQQSWWHAVCLSLPSCLTTLVDLLREPTSSSRTSLRLCQLSLLAVGEVLLCAACVLQASFRLASLKLATTAGGGQGNAAASAPQLDIPASQWQILVYYLLRYLSPPSSASSFGGSGGASAAGDRQPSRTPAASGRLAGSDGVVTETHVRLAAARAIDAFVIAILANDLHDPSAVCPSGNGTPVAGTSLSTAMQAVGAVTSSDVVIRLWTELTGGSDGLSTVSSISGQTGNQLRQDLALTCASAIAGIVRINPALFTSSLIGRVSSGKFLSILELPSNNLTTLVTRLMSAAASGLLLPLSSLFSDKTKQQSPPGLTRQQSNPSGGTGTPAACRRILGDRRFVIAVFRHLECPHAMLRCKAYLLSAAIITINTQDTFPLAFGARLPLCLERDLRATEHINSSQTHSTTGAADACPAEDSSPSAGNSDTKQLVYLAATTQYFVDVLVTSIVPLICNRVSSALGCSPPSGPRKSHNESTCIGPGHRSSNSSSVNMAMARAWLPAYECISNLIVACPMMRARVFNASAQPDLESQATAGSVDEAKTEEQSSGQRQQIPEFSLLVFLGQLLNFWASTDPISSAATVASVHQPGSVENQLLFTSLVIIEEFSQQAELVETCRRDFICLVLPGLARLAVGSGARPETRAICAKIINKIAEQLRCERTSGSFSSLYDPEQQHYLPRQRQRTTSRRRPLSADADVLMMESTTTAAAASHNEEDASQSALAKTQSLSDIQSSRNADRTERCHSLYLPQASTTASGSSQRSVGGRSQHTSVSVGSCTSGGSSVQNNLAAAFHPPSADAIAQLFEVVNQLMIPYADTLITCPEAPLAQTAFIRLLHVLLTTVPSQEPPPPPSTSTIRNSISKPAATDTGVDHSIAARTLVAGISSHGLDVSLVRLLASQLLASGGADNANQHYSCPPSEPLHVTSTLCLTIFRLVPHFLRWPKESRPSRMIIDLRLLELVTIAVLQLGDCFEAASGQALRPEMTRDSPLDLKIDGSKVTRLPKSARQKSSQQTGATLQTGRAGQRKSPVTARRPGFQANRTGMPARSSIPSMCTPLVAALEAMNALLNHVAHIVRIALTARSANYPESETVALAAEEILAASRPPLGLAGLLVRLIHKWQPVKGDEDGSERSTNHQLGELAIRGLTSFASLYGGEYSRTALTRPASSYLSMALLYLSVEDDKAARAEPSATVTVINRLKPPRQPKPNEEFLAKRSRAVYRRRLRLLLRIIRRLISSDPVCRGYLLREASMNKEKANLYTTLGVLSVKAERTADATTLKLLREIIGIVAPSTKFMRNNRAVNSRERAAPVVQAQAISTAI